MGLVAHSPDTASAGIHSREDEISNWEKWGENSPDEWSSRVNVLDSVKGPLTLAALVSGEKLRVGWELET